jgi:hypothetical protein
MEGRNASVPIGDSALPPSLLKPVLATRQSTTAIRISLIIFENCRMTNSKAVSTRQRSDIDQLRRQIMDLRGELQLRDNELKKIAIANLQMAQEIKRLKYETTVKAAGKGNVVAIGKRKAQQ